MDKTEILFRQHGQSQQSWQHSARQKHMILKWKSEDVGKNTETGYTPLIAGMEAGASPRIVWEALPEELDSMEGLAEESMSTGAV